MTSPELLAWRQARKALKAFHKANPKLRGKYLALRRSLGHLKEHQTLVYSLDHFRNLYIIELMDKMRAVLKMYKKDCAQLRWLEREEFRTWDAYNDTLLDPAYRELKNGR